MILTKKLIRSAKVYKKKQLEILGISWPPTHGWMKRLNGTEITDEAWEQVLNWNQPAAPGRKGRYLDYLESDHWKELRRLKKSSANHHCEVCGGGGILHAHHINYKNLTDCLLTDLAALCVACHNDLHYAASQNRISLEGVLLPEIKNILSEFRASDAFRKREQRLLEKPARKVKSTRKQRKLLAQRVKTAVNIFCRSGKCTPDNLRNLIGELQSMVEAEIPH